MKKIKAIVAGLAIGMVVGLAPTAASAATYTSGLQGCYLTNGVCEFGGPQSGWYVKRYGYQRVLVPSTGYVTQPGYVVVR